MCQKKNQSSYNIPNNSGTKKIPNILLDSKKGLNSTQNKPNKALQVLASFIADTCSRKNIKETFIRKTLTTKLTIHN